MVLSSKIIPMKNITKFVSLLFILITTLQSCKKEAQLLPATKFDQGKMKNTISKADSVWSSRQPNTITGN